MKRKRKDEEEEIYKKYYNSKRRKLDKQQILRDVFQMECSKPKKILTTKLLTTNPNVGKFNGTIFIDLDNTLIFTEKLKNDVDYDFCFKVEKYSYGVRKRSGMLDFLIKLKIELGLRVILFSASKMCYIHEVLKVIDDQGIIFDVICHRDHCSLIDHKKGQFITKNIEYHTNDIKRSILVDDNILNFVYTPENGVPVLPWKGERGDTNLIDVVYPSITKIFSSTASDVRPIIKKMYNLKKFFCV